MTDEKKIKKVTIIIQSGTREYTVGYHNVGEIRKYDMENYYFCSVLDTKGEIIAEIYNCPIEVMYE